MAPFNADVGRVMHPDAALHSRTGPWASGLDRSGEQEGETIAGPDLAAQDVIDAFGSFYRHNVVAALRADAVANIDQRRYHAIRVELK